MNNLYDTTYTPPAPILQFFVGAPETSPTHSPLEAIIDTGADITVMPKPMLIALGAPALFSAQLRSPWGELHEITTALNASAALTRFFMVFNLVNPANPVQ